MKSKSVKKISLEILPRSRSLIFKSIAKKFGTPLYVYFEADLLENLKKFLNISVPFGLTVRYAMKANSGAAILRLFSQNGAHIDASTFNECIRAIRAAGIEGKKIRLTSQEVPSSRDLRFLDEEGVIYTACSLLQLKNYGRTLPNSDIGIRFNVGIGSGWTPQTSTGGKSSSFGIFKQWKEIDSILKKYNLCLKTAHLHIGSGSDLRKQREAMKKGLEIVKRFPTVTTLNMGGGFRVAGMNYEDATDINQVGREMSRAIKKLNMETGREIHLEIEPGTALIANAGYILTEVIDKVNTGSVGMEFLKINGGMNMNARIALYGAQHPLVVVPKNRKRRNIRNYVVVGICCESGDVLTVSPGEPGYISPRTMIEAEVGDLLVIGRSGAYCSSMSPVNYNSQQLHPEILVRSNGNSEMIRLRESVESIWQYERIPKDL